jgi:DNA mismatch endonuclease (patch repair protein)
MNKPPDPAPSSAGVSAVMRANKRENTKAEARVRSALHRRGYRFRKHLPIPAQELSVRPDVVFTRQRLAVFVDGCFWHGCPTHGNMPRANSTYWRWKLARNKLRDAAVDNALLQSDWKVLRIWEHIPPDEAVEAIASALAEDRPARSLAPRTRREATREGSVDV